MIGFHVSLRLLFPLKSSENLCFSDDFRENKDKQFTGIHLILEAKIGVVTKKYMHEFHISNYAT